MAQSPTSTSPNHLLERVDDFARQDPTKAVATAFGFGFLFHLLPLGGIVSLLISLLFALARPALLLLGVLKAVDLVRAKSSSDHSQNGRSEPMQESGVET
jgi:hypothetical protein